VVIGGVEGWRCALGWGAGDQEGGILQNKMRLELGLQAFFRKITPPLSPTFRSRSGGSDQSFHSLHRWVGFHLIRSRHTLVCENIF
jgi:hypothetical protein